MTRFCGSGVVCQGTGDCRQGRAPCRTPLTCSGMPVDQAIEAMNRERPARVAHVPAQPEGPFRKPAPNSNLLFLLFVLAVLIAAAIST